MKLVCRRLLPGLVLGLAMYVFLWLNISSLSPIHVFLRDNPDLGYVLLLLNLPAIFLSRVASGMQPSEALVYVLCFLQWFGLGFGLSFLIWPQLTHKPAGPGSLA